MYVTISSFKYITANQQYAFYQDKMKENNKKLQKFQKLTAENTAIGGIKGI